MKTKVITKTESFTLIELMIVVAIIGLLVSLAIPRFSTLIRKSQEATTKGSLGILRTATSVYYADNEGIYPIGGDPTPSLVPKYIERIPVCHTHHHHSIARIQDYGGVSGDTGGWGYWLEIHPEWGKIFVDCIHTDTKGSTISKW